MTLKRTIFNRNTRAVQTLTGFAQSIGKTARTLVVAGLVVGIAATQLKGVGASPQITFIKEVGSVTYASYTYVNSLTINVPASGVAQGDTLIITAGNSTSGMAVSSVSDSRGNSYHVDATKSNSGTSISTSIISGYINTPLTQGNKITINFNGSAALLMALVTEWSGISANGLDKAATNQGSTTSLNGGSVTTTQPGDLLIGSFGGSINANFSPGASFTAFNTQMLASLGSTYRTQWQEYQIAGNNGSYTATGTASKASSYAGAIVAYKAVSDIQPPTSPGNLVQNGSTSSSVGLSWDASTDNVGVTGYDVYNGATLIITTVSTSFTWNGLSCGMVYNLGVDAFDAVGNHSAQSPIVVSTAACDSQPPTIPANLAQTGSTPDSIAVNWDTSTDNVGVAGYGLYLNGQPVGSSTVTSYNFNGLSCGTNYSLGVDAYDALNNRSSEAVISANTDACDLTGPSVDVTAPNGGSLISGSTLFSANASDNVAVASIQFQVDGVNVGNLLTSEPYQIIWDSAQVTNGSHVVTAIATDTSGNSTTSSGVGITTSNDLVAPSVNITVPTNGSLVSGPNTTIAADASDDIGLVGVQFKLDGLNLGPEITGSPYSMVWDTTTSTSGHHSLTAVARDAAGNLTTSAVIQLTVDNAAPNVSISSPANGSYVKGSSLAVVANATDDVAIASVQFELDGVNLGAALPGPSGPYSVQWDTSAVSDGTHSLTAVATDTAGNVTTSDVVIVTVDNVVPTISMTAPNDGATVSGNSVIVSASASDNNAVATVQFKLDGANLGAADSNAPYSINWDTTTVSNGTHQLAAVVTDTAGNNSASNNVSVTVSNVVVNPTPVPAANVNGITVGDGFAEASSRQVVRTVNNAVYVITADDNTCQNGGSGVIHVWKGTGAQAANANVPTGFVEQDAIHHPVSAGSGKCIWSSGSAYMVLSPDSRLDRSGLIQMAYIDGSNKSVYYQTYSTLTDTWGPRNIIATNALINSGSGWPRTGQVALTLDSNDVPHVVYMSRNTSNSVMYVNKVSGTWSSPITIFSGTNEMHPSMVTALDGTLHLTWLDNSLASHSAIKYSRYSGNNWSAAETVSAGDSNVLANTNDDQGPSIATDRNNLPYVLYMDGNVNSSNDYVRMRYRNAGGVWTDNTPPGGSGGASNPAGTWFAHTPQNYITSTGDVFVFLGHDVNISPAGYQYQLNGAGNNWSAYTTIDPRNATNTTGGSPGLDGSASIRFDPLRDNNSGIIDLIYYDEKDATSGYPHHATVFYKAVVIR